MDEAASNISLYWSPQLDEEVMICLQARMVREMRAHNDADPAATNDALADRVEALLARGIDRVSGRCERVAGHEIDHRGQKLHVLEEHQLLRLRSPQLGEINESLVFCAADCELQLLPDDLAAEIALLLTAK